MKMEEAFLVLHAVFVSLLIKVNKVRLCGG
jgi:hypothetical protein